MEPCFADVLRWVPADWEGRHLALAIDATALFDDFPVLAISVVYRGCAIPVAWTVMRANEKHSWREEWLRMLCLLGPAVPKALDVIVLADRGLYAPWLFRQKGRGVS
ncbi:MAG: hypothetical protein ACR2PL_00990 [Dehalococcoidia bacterium]